MPSHNHHFPARPLSSAALRGLNDNLRFRVYTFTPVLRALTLQHNFALTTRDRIRRDKYTSIFHSNFFALLFTTSHFLEKIYFSLICTFFKIQSNCCTFNCYSHHIHNKFLDVHCRTVLTKLSDNWQTANVTRMLFIKHQWHCDVIAMKRIDGVITFLKKRHVLSVRFELP